MAARTAHGVAPPRRGPSRARPHRRWVDRTLAVAFGRNGRARFWLFQGSLTVIAIIVVTASGGPACVSETGSALHTSDDAGDAALEDGCPAPCIPVFPSGGGGCMCPDYTESPPGCMACACEEPLSTGGCEEDCASSFCAGAVASSQCATCISSRCYPGGWTLCQ
jgi:hypothetical protein